MLLSSTNLILARHLKDRDFFVNVSVNKGEDFASISNRIKEANNLRNKIQNGMEILYQSPNANSNLQTLLQASRYSTNKTDKANSTPPNIKSGLDKEGLQGEIAGNATNDKSLQQQLQKLEQQLATNRDKLENAMPEDKPKLREIHKELLQEKRRINAELDKGKPTIHSNLHIGSGTLTGSIAGIETDEQGNISFSPEKFVLGFLAGAAGSKAISSALQHLSKNKEHKKQAIDVIAQSLAQNVPDTLKKYPLLELVLPKKMSTSAQGLQAQTQTMISKLEQKEQRGLFNVTYNGKNATKIYKDLERIDEAIVLEKGFENKKHKGYGARHILKHTQDDTAEGYVTKLEIVNLGKNMRAFLKDNKPFIDSNGARIYEWQDKEGVRFRLVVGDMGKAPTTTDRMPNTLALPERIITFYSDRNLKNPMQFKNPALKHLVGKS